MADIIIMAVIAIAVFFIVRRELKKLKRGQCCNGCPGCSGSCNGHMEGLNQKKEQI